MRALRPAAGRLSRARAADPAGQPPLLGARGYPLTALTRPASLVSLAALSLPVPAPGGLIASIQVIGLTEERVLAFGRVIEAAARPWRPPTSPPHSSAHCPDLRHRGAAARCYASVTLVMKSATNACHGARGGVRGAFSWKTSASISAPRGCCTAPTACSSTRSFVPGSSVFQDHFPVHREVLAEVTHRTARTWTRRWQRPTRLGGSGRCCRAGNGPVSCCIAGCCASGARPRPSSSRLTAASRSRQTRDHGPGRRALLLPRGLG